MSRSNAPVRIERRVLDQPHLGHVGFISHLMLPYYYLFRRNSSKHYSAVALAARHLFAIQELEQRNRVFA
jgi:hypothetical protein